MRMTKASQPPALLRWNPFGLKLSMVASVEPVSHTSVLDFTAMSLSSKPPGPAPQPPT